VIKLLKAVLLGFYFSVPLSAHWALLAPYQPMLVLVFFSLVVIHLIEYAMFRKRLAAISNGQNHLMQTVSFGFLYWQPLLAGQRKNG